MRFHFKQIMGLGLGGRSFCTPTSTIKKKQSSSWIHTQLYDGTLKKNGDVPFQIVSSGVVFPLQSKVSTNKWTVFLNLPLPTETTVISSSTFNQSLYSGLDGIVKTIYTCGINVMNRESLWTPGTRLTTDVCSVWRAHCLPKEIEEKLNEGIGSEGKPTEDCDSALQAHVITKVP